MTRARSPRWPTSLIPSKRRPPLTVDRTSMVVIDAFDTGPNGPLNRPRSNPKTGDPERQAHGWSAVCTHDDEITVGPRRRILLDGGDRPCLNVGPAFPTGSLDVLASPIPSPDVGPPLGHLGREHAVPLSRWRSRVGRPGARRPDRGGRRAARRCSKLAGDHWRSRRSPTHRQGVGTRRRPDGHRGRRVARPIGR